MIPLRYALYDFTSQQYLITVVYDTHAEARAARSNNQCIILVDDPDSPYGIDGCCDHALEPWDCVYCNPAHHHLLTED